MNNADMTGLYALSFTPSDEGMVAKEWVFDSVVHDQESAVGACALCGRRHVRYQYRIRNRLTHHFAWVGETCLLRSGIKGWVKKTRVSGSQLKPALREARLRCLHSKAVTELEKVASQNGHKALLSALSRYRKHGKLTPNQCSALLIAAAKECITIDPGLFTITLRKKAHKAQVVSMKPYSYKLLLEHVVGQEKEILEKVRGNG